LQLELKCSVNQENYAELIPQAPLLIEDDSLVNVAPVGVVGTQKELGSISWLMTGWYRS